MGAYMIVIGVMSILTSLNLFNISHYSPEGLGLIAFSSMTVLTAAFGVLMRHQMIASELQLSVKTSTDVNATYSPTKSVESQIGRKNREHNNTLVMND